MQLEACVTNGLTTIQSGFGRVGAIHQIDGLGALCKTRIFVAAGEIEPQAREPAPKSLPVPHLSRGVEIQVDRGAIHDSGNLIILVIVIECACHSA